MSPQVRAATLGVLLILSMLPGGFRLQRGSCPG